MVVNSKNVQSNRERSFAIFINVANVVLFFLIIGLATIQFTLPFAEKEGEVLTSFEALSLLDMHWGFGYFYFMIFVLLLAIILFVISLKVETPKWCDFSLWMVAFVGLLVFMIALQGFLDANPSLGIDDNSKNGVFSYLLVGIALIIAVGRLYIEYEKLAKKALEETLTPEFKRSIENKNILYENTIHLNPQWYVTIAHPDPLRMVVTDKEIIISSSPLTKIPLSSIAKITHNSMYQTAFRIHCKDGRKYKILWGPANKTLPYSILETRDIKDNLNRILKGHRPLEKRKKMIDNKKSYMWSILYIALLIIGQALAGIGGMIGAFIISFGVHKVVRNPDLSTSKKWVYSILCTVGGLIVAFLVMLVFALILIGTSEASESQVLADVSGDVPAGEYGGQSFSIAYATELTINSSSSIPVNTCLADEVEFQNFNTGKDFGCLGGTFLEEGSADSFKISVGSGNYYYLFFDGELEAFTYDLLVEVSQ